MVFSGSKKWHWDRIEERFHKVQEFNISSMLSSEKKAGEWLHVWPITSRRMEVRDRLENIGKMWKNQEK